MVRPMASAWIWHHRSELAPPPTKAREGKERLQYFSTAPSNQAEFRATPSNTARTMSARVDDSEMLWKPPRMVWSSTGERSPFSQGVNRTPCEPTGTDAATSLRRAKKLSGGPAVAGAAAAPAVEVVDSASSGNRTLSRSQVRQAPPVSCSSATR